MGCGFIFIFWGSIGEFYRLPVVVYACCDFLMLLEPVFLFFCQIEGGLFYLIKVTAPVDFKEFILFICYGVHSFI
ncbi:hypothetical protein MCHI_001851 [Candidatus Magnetoovum chiemensis]|nr:hypothetical protein MCHI_001851 [Candidatus Magnetoovum chiemensis]